MEEGGKRKRTETTTTDPSQAAVGRGAAVSWPTLLHPNFEELARHFPTTFGLAYREVEARRQKAIAEEQTASHGKRPSKAVVALESYVTPDFSWQLAQALLQRHWRLTLVDVPRERYLCPPIPNRFHLVDWLQTTLLPRVYNAAGAAYFVRPSPASPTTTTSHYVALDIGTGASCIYPLLWVATASRQGPSTGTPPWQVYATDVDAAAIAWAQQNVQANHLTQAIAPRLVLPSTAQQEAGTESSAMTTTTTAAESPLPCGPFAQSLRVMPAWEETAGPQPQFAICLTNPPFDDSTDDTARTAARRDGRARTPLTATEGWYPGGEVAFVGDILVDQWVILLQHMARPNDPRQPATDRRLPPQLPTWTACMCGKKASALRLEHILRDLLGVAHVATSDFGPGALTRWFVAWTFSRPIMRSPMATHAAWTFDISLAQDMTREEAAKEIHQRLTSYCASKADWHLQVEVSATSAGIWQMRQAGPVQWQAADQESQLAWLPVQVRQASAIWDVTHRAALLLPPEGHFLLDVALATSGSAASSSSWTLSCHSFAHTSYGKRRVAQIQAQLAGEVARTTRRWRRLLKSQAPDDEAMDITPNAGS
jgi:23S rRNA A1618 N6-methylase RlmF